MKPNENIINLMDTTITLKIHDCKVSFPPHPQREKIIQDRLDLGQESPDNNFDKFIITKEVWYSWLKANPRRQDVYKVIMRVR